MISNGVLMEVTVDFFAAIEIGHASGIVSRVHHRIPIGAKITGNLQQANKFESKEDNTADFWRDLAHKYWSKIPLHYDYLPFILTKKKTYRHLF